MKPRAKDDLTKVYKGLEGITVDTTAICAVDGDRGRLSYRGKGIETLCQRSFEEVAFLVLTGKEPSADQRAHIGAFLAKEAALSPRSLATLATVAASVHPMQVLQSLIPLLQPKPSEDFGLARELGAEGVVGLSIAAKLPSVVAALHRQRLGQPILAPKRGMSFHENFLYMFTGQTPTAEEVAIFDTTQILQMEHGFNASTFAARVTASTLAPVESALSSAVGTLFGKLHGGADQAALEMVLAIGEPDRAEAFVLAALREKTKIMGLGHRVYRVVDPRAKILKPMARALCLDTPFEPLYRTFEQVEEVMAQEMAKKDKQVKANVEFYKAPVFYALGFPPQYFTSLFAISRMFGYLAHVLESRKDNRLIRPKALYIGP